MAEDLLIQKGTNKIEAYQSIIPQIKALVSYETDMIANMGNIAAALKEQFDFFWVGFYLVKGDELLLGPFQGPVACTRIPKGQGVCGVAWEKGEVLLVPDVDAFPGHIACSSASKSEIVLPVYRNNEIIGVLDVDSAELSSFNEVDQQYLSEIVTLFDVQNSK